MSKSKKTSQNSGGNSGNLKPWAKGQSGNPGGRPKLPADVKAARIMDKVALSRAMHELIHASDEILTALVASPTAPALSKALASVLLKAIEDGDMQRVEGLLRRYIGPVESTVNMKFPKPTVVRRFGSTESVVLGHEVEEESEEG